MPSEVVTASGVEATVLLSSVPKHDVIAVPNIYVKYDQRRDSYYTFVMSEDGTPRRRELTVSLTDGVSRIVTNGLSVGERVVVG